MEEQWKEVPGFPDYRVSDHGNVIGPRRAPALNPFGPGYTSVSLTHAGYTTRILLHRLVLSVFQPNVCTKLHALHNDGNPENNRLSNLRWGTPRENMRDKRGHGTHIFGEGMPLAKLKNADIPVIRSRLAAGETYRSIAEAFQVRIPTISAIAQGKTWRHVPFDGPPLPPRCPRRRGKLYRAEVDQMRRLRSKGARIVDLAKQFGISSVSVQNIVSNRTWKLKNPLVSTAATKKRHSSRSNQTGLPTFTQIQQEPVGSDQPPADSSSLGSGL